MRSANVNPDLTVALGIIVPGLASVYYLVTAISQYVGAKATKRWRPVQGEITHSEVEGVRAQSGNSTRPFFRPDIRYNYSALGEPYEGRLAYVGSDEWLQTRKRAAGLVAKYPIGGVTVYVNPFKPSEAVLEPAQYAAARRSIIIAVLAGTFGVLFVWGALAAM